MEVRAKGVASALPNLIDTLRNAGNIPLVVSPRKLKAVAGENSAIEFVLNRQPAEDLLVRCLFSDQN